MSRPIWAIITFMEVLQIFGYLGALAIGLILGLTGSGGSLLAIPILTYLFHIEPVTTTAYSLFVVGTTASLGSIRFINTGYVDVRKAISFGLPCLMLVYFCRRFLMPAIPDHIAIGETLSFSKGDLVMILFTVLVLFAAFSMLRARPQVIGAPLDTLAKRKSILFWEGMVVGILTGIVGIGGGFLIVPALVFYADMPIKKAVATSLLIVAIKSMVGFLGDLAHVVVEWQFLLLFTSISLSGILIGSYLGRYLNGHRLKRLMGWMLMLLAMGMLIRESGLLRL